MFKGIYTALLTPFNDRLELDQGSLVNLLKLQSSSINISGVVIAGTTGESPCLSNDEIKIIISIAKQLLRKDQKIILGISANCLSVAVDKLDFYSKFDEIDAYMVVTPYYNKPSQSGLIKYYESIASCSNKPIILYNVPSRTGVDLKVETINKLSEINEIVAIKEANDDLNKIQSLLKISTNINVLSGNDHLNSNFSQLGASGVISVLSNVAPELVASQFLDKIDNNLKKKLNQFSQEIAQKIQLGDIFFLLGDRLLRTSIRTNIELFNKSYELKTNSLSSCMSLKYDKGNPFNIVSIENRFPYDVPALPLINSKGSGFLF